MGCGLGWHEEERGGGGGGRMISLGVDIEAVIGGSRRLKCRDIRVEAAGRSWCHRAHRGREIREDGRERI